MKTLFLTLYMLVNASTTPERPSTKLDDCNCTYPLKENTTWCEGPKGGLYCWNRQDTKYYKPKPKPSN